MWGESWRVWVFASKVCQSNLNLKQQITFQPFCHCWFFLCQWLFVRKILSQRLFDDQWKVATKAGALLCFTRARKIYSIWPNWVLPAFIWLPPTSTVRLIWKRWLLACYTGHHYRPGTSRDALSCTTTELISESHSPPTIEKHTDELGPTPKNISRSPSNTSTIPMFTRTFTGSKSGTKAGFKRSSLFKWKPGSYSSWTKFQWDT